MIQSTEYDAIIIGSGQGGNPLAHTLADRSWRVALIERRYLGGSCINYGCTPTKTMLASARVAQTVRRASEYGINSSAPTVDLPHVIARKDRIVIGMRQGQQKQIDSRDNLDLFRGTGSFVDARTIRVNDHQLTAPHIFVDTGSSPRIPDVPGLADTPYFTNLNIMDLTTLPQHLLILGGGYLALEFGQMFRRFGSQVTIVEHGPQIAQREDREIALELQSALEEEGITFHLNAEATHVTGNGNAITMTLNKNGNAPLELHGTHLLVASGRVPNSADLQPEKASIDLDEQGYIVVNKRLETSAPGIWAIGDVTGNPAFTHVAYDDHLIILDHLFGDKKRTKDDRIIPYALFTDPELGRVGMSEQEAVKAGLQMKTATMPMSYVARAREEGKTAGLMKVIIDATNDQVLGATILGTIGGELVQHFATMMRAKVPYTVLKQAIYIHPTLTEGFYTLIERVAEPSEQSD